MSGEQKNVNAEAEKDVQSTLAELKAEQPAPANGDAEKKDDAEEARIVEAAAKLGDKSEKTEKGDSRNGGQGRKGRNNIKFDPSTQKETNDPVEIRKQVS